MYWLRPFELCQKWRIASRVKPRNCRFSCTHKYFDCLSWTLPLWILLNNFQPWCNRETPNILLLLEILRILLLTTSNRPYCQKKIRKNSYQSEHGAWAKTEQIDLNPKDTNFSRIDARKLKKKNISKSVLFWTHRLPSSINATANLILRNERIINRKSIKNRLTKPIATFVMGTGRSDRWNTKPERATETINLWKRIKKKIIQ